MRQIAVGAELDDVRRPNAGPARATVRPAQPLRPLPATKTVTDHLALKARRRRYRLRPTR